MRSPFVTSKLPAVGRPRSGRRRHGGGSAVYDYGSGPAPRGPAKNTTSSSTTGGNSDVDGQLDLLLSRVRRGIYEDNRRTCPTRRRPRCSSARDHEVSRGVGLTALDAELDRGDWLQRGGVVAVEALPIADPPIAPSTTPLRSAAGPTSVFAKRATVVFVAGSMATSSFPVRTHIRAVGRLQLERTNADVDGSREAHPVSGSKRKTRPRITAR